jgi:hypothetical protein
MSGFTPPNKATFLPLAGLAGVSAGDRRLWCQIQVQDKLVVTRPSEMRGGAPERRRIAPAGHRRNRA